MTEVETAEIVGKLCLEAYIKGQVDAIDNITDVMDSTSLPFVTKAILVDMKNKVFANQNVDKMLVEMMKVFKEKRNIS